MAKTKALISLAATVKLICVFVFTYTKIRFSHDTAKKTIGMDSADTQNCSEWRECLQGFKMMMIMMMMMMMITLN